MNEKEQLENFLKNNQYYTFRKEYKNVDEILLDVNKKARILLFDENEKCLGTFGQIQETIFKSSQLKITNSGPVKKEIQLKNLNNNNKKIVKKKEVTKVISKTEIPKIGIQNISRSVLNESLLPENLSE